MSFPTTTVLDLFNRSEDPLSQGGAWNATTPVLPGDSLLRTNGSGAWGRYPQVSSSCRAGVDFTDCETYLTVTRLPGSYEAVRLYARITNPGTASASGYLAQLTTAGGIATVALYKVTAGAIGQQLGSSYNDATSLPCGLGIEAAGGVIRVFYRSASGVWVERITVSDSSYPHGTIGVGLNWTNPLIDDFGGGSTSTPRTPVTTAKHRAAGTFANKPVFIRKSGSFTPITDLIVIGQSNLPPPPTADPLFGVNMGGGAVDQELTGTNAHEIIAFDYARFSVPITTTASQIGTWVDLYNAAGITPLVCATFTNRIPTQSEAQGLGAWATALQGKVLGIEFGSETANSSQPASWQQGGLYATRAREAAVAINGKVKLIVQGRGDNPAWLAQMREAVVDIGNYADGWSLRYLQQDYSNVINAYRAALAGFAHPDVWVTSMGWATDDGLALNDAYGWPVNMTYQAAATNLQTFYDFAQSKVAAIFYSSIHDLSPHGANNQRDNYLGALAYGSAWGDWEVKPYLTDKVRELCGARPYVPAGAPGVPSTRLYPSTSLFPQGTHTPPPPVDPGRLMPSATLYPSATLKPGQSNPPIVSDPPPGIPPVPTNRWYATSSPWNQRVTGIPIHSNSQAIVNTILDGLPGVYAEDGGAVGPTNDVIRWQAGANWNSWDFEHPIFFASDTDPFKTIVGGAYGGTPIRVPAAATPATSSDGHLAIVQRDGRIYEFWQAVIGPTSISCSWGDRADINGDGRGTCTAGWFSLGAGVLRPAEMVSGIHHALFFVTNVYGGTTAPSTGTGQGAQRRLIRPDVPKFGQRLKLDLTDVEISNLPSHLRILATACRDYGLIVGDTGGGGLHGDNSVRSAWTAPSVIAGVPVSGGTYTWDLRPYVNMRNKLKVLAEV